MQIQCLSLCICMHLIGCKRPCSSIGRAGLLYNLYCSDASMEWNLSTNITNYLFYLFSVWFLNVLCTYNSTCDRLYCITVEHSNNTPRVFTLVSTDRCDDDLCAVCILSSLTLFRWEQSSNTAGCVAETALVSVRNEEVWAFCF